MSRRLVTNRTRCQTDRPVRPTPNVDSADLLPSKKAPSRAHPRADGSVGIGRRSPRRRRSIGSCATTVCIVSVYIWSDVCPEDGCTLVRFSMRATSLRAVVTAAEVSLGCSAQLKVTCHGAEGASGRVRACAGSTSRPGRGSSTGSRPGVSALGALVEATSRAASWVCVVRRCGGRPS